MTNPVCASCGQPLIPGSRFCGRCGAPATLQATTPQTIGPTPGWNTPFRGTQYIIDEKILAIRDTFGIKDTSGNLLAYVKQQLLSFGPKFWNEATDGTRLGEIHGKVIAIRPTLEIYNSQNHLQAVIKKKILELIGSRWRRENASGKELATCNGHILKH